MNEHLEKAKGAIQEAREKHDAGGSEIVVARLLRIAEAQAWVSMADSLECLAEHFGDPS